MIPANIIPFPDIRHARHCSGCTVCGRSDGYLNLGSTHWFICREHKTKWLIGDNLFDSWMTQTVAQHISAERLLRTYQEVFPFRELKTRQRLMFPVD